MLFGMPSLRIKLNHHQNKTNSFTLGSYWAGLKARLPNLCTKIYAGGALTEVEKMPGLSFGALYWTNISSVKCRNEWNYHLQNSLLPTQSRLSIQASLKAIQHPWEGKGEFSFLQFLHFDTEHHHQQHTNHSLQHSFFLHLCSTWNK